MSEKICIWLESDYIDSAVKNKICFLLMKFNIILFNHCDTSIYYYSNILFKYFFLLN